MGRTTRDRPNSIMSKETTCLGLTSLRGIAALAVVVQHCLLVLRISGNDDVFNAPMRLSDPWLLHQHALLMLFNGEAAVVLFFVLSGLVLTLSIQRDEPLGIATTIRYWIRRIFRLYPLLVAAAVMSAAFFTLAPAATQLPNASSWAVQHFNAEVTANTLVKTGLGISNVLNPPVWTITIEIAASMLFPVFYLIATRATALGKVIALCCFVFLTLASPVRFRYIEVYLIAFFLGALIVFHGRPFAVWVWSLGPAARSAFVVLIALVALAAKRLIAPEIWNDGLTALVISIACTAIVTVVYFGPRRGLLESPVLVRLGDISYGVYLIHFPVMITLLRLVAPHMPTTITPTATLAFHLALAGSVIAVTLPLAAMSFRFLELPLQNLGRQFARNVGRRLSRDRTRLA